MIRKAVMGVAVALLTIAAPPAAADGRGANSSSDSKHGVSAKLKPTNEVPALSSAASGRFSAVIDEANETISYELSYDGLEGNVAQAHIHLGQAGVNGGVSVFLCGNPPAVPAATVPQPPACPPPPATVTGVLTPAHIVGPNSQGIAPTSATTNEFAELVRAILDRARVTYVNLHTSKFTGGEIRGQLRRGHGHGGSDD